ncbi:MAG: hypothetical protein ACTHWH_01275 [Marinobacter sp.]
MPPYAGGGLNAGLGDLARVGQLMLNESNFNGEQLVPAEAVRNIREGGDPELFAKAGYNSMANGSYKSMWWFFHNGNDAYAAGRSSLPPSNRHSHFNKTGRHNTKLRIIIIY